MFSITLACVVILCVLFKVINFRKIYLASKLSGPPALPIIGNALQFLNKSALENFQFVNSTMDKYGSIVRFWSGTSLIVMLSDPSDIETVLLNSDLTKDNLVYRILKPWLNEGLLLSLGEKWFKRRKMITPAFHFSNLENYIDSFNHHSYIFLNRFSKCDPFDKLEISEYISAFTLDVICESAMGVTSNAQTTDSAYMKAVHILTETLILRMYQIQCRFDFLYQFTSYAQTENKYLKIVHDFTDGVIAERRLQTKHTVNLENNPGKASNKINLNLLDILLQSSIDEKPLNDLDIREEVDTFMFEGHDTTSSALVFSFYCLACNIDVQQKCFEELKVIFGNDTTKHANFRNLNDMKYLDLTIKETLRLFPPVPLFVKKAVQEININGKQIPSGTEIYINLAHMGRNQKWFEDAGKFRPERFISSTHPTFAYIPFSAGQRNCVGQKFAMLEIKTLLSTFLRNYEITLATDHSPNLNLNLSCEFVLKTKNIFKYHIRRRVY